MVYHPDIHRRRSLRLKHYDYSQAGAYFLTFCSQHRECRFGEVGGGQFIPNAEGTILQNCWQSLPAHFPDIELDGAVIMPNHFHGIVVILQSAGMTHLSTNLEHPRHSSFGGKISLLGKVVAYFKYQTTKAINQRYNSPGRKVWQRNYYEHIIRNDRSLGILRDYIINNPQKWEIDQLNPKSNPP